MTAQIFSRSRMSAAQKTASASLATASAMALCLALAPSPAENDRSDATGLVAEQTDLPTQGAPLDSTTSALDDALAQWQGEGTDDAPDPLAALAEAKSEDASPAQLKAAEAAAGQDDPADDDASATAEEQVEEKTERKAEQQDAEQKTSDSPRSDSATHTTQASSTAPTPAHADDLDGWIREALAIMDEHGIPGTYEGLHRNIIRESSGDPTAVNDWDINARNGIPSKGLLQVIQPTFDAYHVPGTERDLFDPVANLTAAANYAADRYGSIDNVDGPY